MFEGSCLQHKGHPVSPGWPGHSPRVKSTRLGWQSRSFRLLVRLVQVGDLGLLGCSKSIFPLSEQLCSEDWLQKSGFLIKKKDFSEDTHIHVFSWLAQERTGYAQHPSWLCSSCNKQATEPHLSLAWFSWQTCPLCRPGREQGYSHPTSQEQHRDPGCTEPASEARALREPGSCSWWL